MLDPVTTISLVAAVTQFIGQAIKVTIVCKDICERGSLDENDEIEKSAEKIATAKKDLEEAIKEHPSSSLTASLTRTAQDVSVTAEELRKVLDELKLKKKGNRKIGNAFVATLDTLHKKGTAAGITQSSQG